MPASTHPGTPVPSFAVGGGAHVITCFRCGSHHVHRSHPRNSLEQLVRTFTPLRFHRCSECGQRGYHWTWSAPRAVHPEALVATDSSGSPVLYRDTLARRIRRRRILHSILVATVLGVLASVVALTR